VTAVPYRSSASLLALYDRALPQVYGYLIVRCGDQAVAEDLTSEMFLAAAATHEDVPPSVGWLIGWPATSWWTTGVAKPARSACCEQWSAFVAVDDPWDVQLDIWHAREVLTRLAPQHRAALTLRHLDGLGIPEAATVLGRSVAATEALLVRARREFRRLYEESSDA
jgi:RNA polymerase sigma-70 factor (ECF subfamily)